MPTPSAKDSARRVCNLMGLSKKETEIVVSATDYCPKKSLDTYRLILRTYRNGFAA